MRKIFKKNRIKPFKVFDENNLSSLPRIILSSVLVILFFYSLPIIVNFTSNKIESSAGIQNNSKAILAYTLNKKSSNSSSSKTFNEDDTWIYIERTLSKGKYHKLGRHKLKTNNTLILNFDKYGVLVSKDLYDKDKINEIQFSKKETENNLSKKSFVETFLNSVKKKMYGNK